MDQKQQFDTALSMLGAGNAAGAARHCEISLEQYPGDANLLCLSARAHIAQKEFEAARQRIKEAIHLFPDFAVAHETLGDLMLLEGNVSKAMAAFQTAMRLDPTRPSPGQKIEYVRKLQKDGITRSRPEGVVAFASELAKAHEHSESGDSRSAEMIYRQILTKDPDHVEASRLLATIASEQKQFRDAEVFLRKAISNAPNYVRLWVDLVAVLREQDKLADALESAKEVVRLAPDNSESYIVLASAIGMTGYHEEAIESYQTALQMSPDRPGAWCGMAHHLKTVGRQDDAIESYRKAIVAREDHAEAYWSLANLKTFRFRDEEVRVMAELLERSDLPDESRAQLHNALGLEFEARKDYDKAFEHFDACNRVQRLLESYDPVDTEDTYGRIIDFFTPDRFVSNAGVASSDVTPILVVGLPRSGSTLIEQILASHSQVDGTHELSDLPRVVQATRKGKPRRVLFPDFLSDLGPAEWRAIGEHYLSRTEQFRAGAPFFIDKNPNNFIYTGIMKLAIPNVKIIDARRHPLDSCFGSFKQLFASGQPFTYDLTELGEYYLQYRRLMEHWQKMLPGFFLEVNYEKIVADLETEIRRLLEFCGLPFEESCLRFHETERAVKTASSEQVRRPIYSSSVNLWRNYESHIEELTHILEPLLKDLPADQQPEKLDSASP
ncbi:MAG: sulfotransferase [Pseudomonadota bacterium]|nr:sulfotransferase [Pseudomonadota bacterium]